MKDLIRKLNNEAEALNYCGLFDGYETIEQFVDLFFTMRGMTYCAHHQFPSLRLWKEIDKKCDLSRFGIYVDGSAAIRSVITAHTKTAFVGNVVVDNLVFPNDGFFEVVLLHGAAVRKHTKNGAIIKTISDNPIRRGKM